MNADVKCGWTMALNRRGSLILNAKSTGNSSMWPNRVLANVERLNLVGSKMSRYFVTINIFLKYIKYLKKDTNYNDKQFSSVAFVMNN